MANKYSLKIGWLYPELMSTYGDRGNIIVFQRRGAWRNIAVEIVNIDEKTTKEELKKIDLIFGGGAQDREQEIVMRDLLGKKGEVIKELIEKNTPALFVCGAPQLMGKYYEPAEGKRIEGLGIFDMVSVHPGKNKERLIGNIVAEIVHEGMLNSRAYPGSAKMMVGFENHGGRTYLGENVRPFAKVLKGFGNNGEDGTEGVAYKNAVGTYLHGPLLPKNPRIADYFIQKALEIKYDEKIDLKPLDDSIELQAQKAIAQRLDVEL